jgi:tryptophan halogenase
MAARAGRFAHLPDGRMNYAYQLDSGLYAAFLRRLAEADGATRIEGRIARGARWRKRRDRRTAPGW